MKSKRFLLVICYIFAAILPSIFYTVDAINNSSNLILILSGILGITSYVLLAFQFLLVSRTKIIDKQFGLDRIYRFHMVIGPLAVLFAFIHKMLKGIYFSDSFQTSLGDNAFLIFVIISVFSILMMINKLFFKVKVVDYIRQILNNTLKIKYQYKVLIHNIMLIGLIVLLVHILLAFSVSSNLLLEITLIIYFAIPFALYFNHKIIKAYFDKNKKYTVSEVINESNNIVTLKFKPKYDKVFNYLPGQFLYVKINNNEIPGDEHPFTISSSPSQLDFVSVTVKQLGDFTSRLNKVKVGDNAYIDGAFGSFSYLKKPNYKKICFIAGGIGITPFLGMLRHMNSTDNSREVVLLWGARDQSEVICKSELDDYVLKFKAFKFVPILSNDENYSGEKGFIDTNKIKKYLKNVSEYDFYLCGPPIMMDIQLKNLKALGVSKENIHFERFAI